MLLFWLGNGSSRTLRCKISSVTLRGRRSWSCLHDPLSLPCGFVAIPAVIIANKHSSTPQRPDALILYIQGSFSWSLLSIFLLIRLVQNLRGYDAAMVYRFNTEACACSALCTSNFWLPPISQNRAKSGRNKKKKRFLVAILHSQIAIPIFSTIYNVALKT